MNFDVIHHQLTLRTFCMNLVCRDANSAILSVMKSLERTASKELSARCKNQLMTHPECRHIPLSSPRRISLPFVQISSEPVLRKGWRESGGEFNFIVPHDSRDKPSEVVNHKHTRSANLSCSAVHSPLFNFSSLLSLTLSIFSNSPGTS